MHISPSSAAGRCVYPAVIMPLGPIDIDPPPKNTRADHGSLAAESKDGPTNARRANRPRPKHARVPGKTVPSSSTHDSANNYFTGRATLRKHINTESAKILQRPSKLRNTSTPIPARAFPVSPPLYFMLPTLPQPRHWTDHPHVRRPHQLILLVPRHSDRHLLAEGDIFCLGHQPTHAYLRPPPSLPNPTPSSFSDLLYSVHSLPPPPHDI